MRAKLAEDLVDDWVRYLRTGDDALLDEVFTADHHDHVSGQRGHEIYRTVNGWFATSFADLEFAVHGIATNDDGLVMVWLSVRGRHVGNTFPQLRALAEPSGRGVTWTHTHIFRTDGDRFGDHWAVRDDRGLLEQVGG